MFRAVTDTHGYPAQMAMQQTRRRSNIIANQNYIPILIF